MNSTAVDEQAKRYIEELTESNARLQEFASTVAHDLREPLRAICLYTQILFPNVSGDSDQAQMASFVISSCGRLSNLVNDLLEFASTGVHQSPQPIDLKRCLNTALQNLSLEISQSCSVISIGNLPVVSANETPLVRVFQNLISNAIKYHGDKPPSITVTALEDGSNCIVRVKDTGMGISEADQTRAFLPFVRLVDRKISGTGLGLAVSKKIVESFGGTIWVESELGTGSTFAFSIPT